jgi:hypothetical protein
VWRNNSYKIEIKCLGIYLDPRDLKLEDILRRRLYFLLLWYLSHEGYNRQNAACGMGTKKSRNNHCGKPFVKRLLAVKMRIIWYIVKKLLNPYSAYVGKYAKIKSLRAEPSHCLFTANTAFPAGSDTVTAQVHFPHRLNRFWLTLQLILPLPPSSCTFSSFSFCVGICLVVLVFCAFRQEGMTRDEQCQENSMAISFSVQDRHEMSNCTRSCIILS